MNRSRSLIALLLLFILSACAHPQTASLKTEAALPETDLSLLPAFRPSEGSGPALAMRAANDSKLDPAFFDDDLDFLDDEDIYDPPPLVADPLAPFNRAMFVFNDRLYFWLLKPVAQGYNAVLPETVRTAVQHFFHNLKMPVRFANCLLQGKGEAAAMELGRFMYNSTFGILGLGNPVRHYPELNPPEEDLGQTLGFYGLGNGFYIVWPVLGPSTLRDSAGRLGDSYGYPISYVEPLSSRLGLQGWDQLNRTSLRLGEYEALIESVFEPYVAMRDLYIQHRQHRVRE